ncbi:VOC family protein [Actinacidiphila glaucinigra]|uniref:VOC family protein n=1 Tax=Actinacidiphila glaucinigra TaxID=235986 RepID=UPI0036AFA36E
MRTGTDREPREHDGVTSTFRGLATIRHHAEDLAAAKAWYSELLGVEPYFDTPDYIEFRLGDHSQELGVSRTPSAPAGVVAYWHVDDVGAVWERLLSLGARAHEAPRDHGHPITSPMSTPTWPAPSGTRSNQSPPTPAP